ncbi:MAG TPA: gliding motility-associated C-terminal domain-containing protein, partial [Saprospiraceae bacterium]|nr:gliding motility-associated C-terminal domain-containing protein [Saprospiraceae bacterium]
DQITIDEVAKISISISYDTTAICTGYPIQLAANVLLKPSNLIYSWESPSGVLSGNIITAISAGSYSVTVTDSNGCTGQSNINMPVFLPLSVEESVNQPSCKDPLGSYTIENITGGTGPYNIIWEIDPAIDFNTTYQQQNLNPGQYAVQVIDANNCNYLNDITILADVGALSINAGEDITVEKGDTAFINPSYTGNVIQYSWKPVNFLDCNNCPSAIVKPEISVEYIIVIKDSLGCVASDKIKVNVIESNLAYIPNVFSPNADGINDLFTVYTTPRVKLIREFQIYNRWGDHVYSLTNQDPSVIWGWNGKFNDKYVNSDVYVYYVVLELLNGQLKVFKGDITVFR